MITIDFTKIQWRHVGLVAVAALLWGLIEGPLGVASALVAKRYFGIG